MISANPYKLQNSTGTMSRFVLWYSDTLNNSIINSASQGKSACKMSSNWKSLMVCSVNDDSTKTNVKTYWYSAQTYTPIKQWMLTIMLEVETIKQLAWISFLVYWHMTAFTDAIHCVFTNNVKTIWQCWTATQQTTFSCSKSRLMLCDILLWQKVSHTAHSIAFRHTLLPANFYQILFFPKTMPAPNKHVG
jgi:hypothetical protein